MDYMGNNEGIASGAEERTDKCKRDHGRICVAIMDKPGRRSEQKSNYEESDHRKHKASEINEEKAQKKRRVYI